jgi:RecB family endonuclease NucS
VDPDKKSSETIRPQTIEEIGASERYDLQEWIKQNPDIIEERLFIITSEFDQFAKSQKRLNLLALDEKGKLVVVELKRDAAGTLADLQAIRYAASCSSFRVEISCVEVTPYRVGNDNRVILVPGNHSATGSEGLY